MCLYVIYRLENHHCSSENTLWRLWAMDKSSTENSGENIFLKSPKPATTNLWAFFPRRNLSLQIVGRPQTTCRFRHSCSHFCLSSTSWLCSRPQDGRWATVSCLNSFGLQAVTVISSKLWAKIFAPFVIHQIFNASISFRVFSHLLFLVWLNRTLVRFPPWYDSSGEVWIQ